MKDEWTNYLRAVGFQDPLLQRADSTLRFYNDFAGIAVEQIFVSEYQSDKGRTYESLWVFSGDCIGEAALFGEKEHLDLIPLSNNIARFEMQKTGFNSGDTPTDASRLTVHIAHVYGSSGLSSTLKASGINCLQLEAVLRKFIIPVLRQN